MNQQSKVKQYKPTIPITSSSLAYTQQTLASPNLFMFHYWFQTGTDTIKDKFSSYIIVVQILPNERHNFKFNTGNLITTFQDNISPCLSSIESNFTRPLASNSKSPNFTTIHSMSASRFFFFCLSHLQTKPIKGLIWNLSPIQVNDKPSIKFTLPKQIRSLWIHITLIHSYFPSTKLAALYFIKSSVLSFSSNIKRFFQPKFPLQNSKTIHTCKQNQYLVNG